MKEDWKLFGCLRRSYSAFSSTKALPLGSLLVAKDQNGDGQKPQLLSEEIKLLPPLKLNLLRIPEQFEPSFLTTDHPQPPTYAHTTRSCV